MNKKLGVYVCHCGTNISGIGEHQRVGRVREEPADVKGRVITKFMCSTPARPCCKRTSKRKASTASSGLLLAPDTSRLSASLRESHLNRYQFQMANIREHCSWVHTDKGRRYRQGKALLSAPWARRATWPAASKKVRSTPLP